MARLARLAVAGQAHHLIQRGNNGQAIFVDDEDRNSYLASLREAASTHAVAIHAYVLMDNHVHLLLSLPAIGAIGRLMQNSDTVTSASSMPAIGELAHYGKAATRRVWSTAKTMYCTASDTSTSIRSARA